MSIVSYLSAPPTAIQQCSIANSTIASCFPTNTTNVAQGSTIDFIWNSNIPEFVQSGVVDIKVFRAVGDIEPSVFGIYNVTNPTDGSAGRLTIDVADGWFDGPFNGFNISTPFFFTIAPSGTIPRAQATFRAVQTGPTSPQTTFASGSAVATATPVTTVPFASGTAIAITEPSGPFTSGTGSATTEPSGPFTSGAATGAIIEPSGPFTSGVATGAVTSPSGPFASGTASAVETSSPYASAI